MNEITFFNQLLQKTHQQFLKSSVYQKRVGQNQWNYSICGTPVQRGKGIVMGINWGADDNHEPQSQMPDGSDIMEYKFISRSAHLLAKHLQLDVSKPTFNYANLCFFRSKIEGDRDAIDYELSLPLFHEYVEYIQPPWLLSLGLSNYYRLAAAIQLEGVDVVYDSEQRFSGVKALLWGSSIYFVPHPNARVKNASREEIWQKLLLKQDLQSLYSEVER